MKLESIKYGIENGKHLGIQMKTDDNEVGWYRIFKLNVANNFFEKYSEIVEEEYLEEQTKIRDYPYSILECKVAKYFFLQKKEIKNESDFLLHKKIDLSTFDEVLIFFNSKGYTLDDFVWLIDLKYID